MGRKWLAILALITSLLILTPQTLSQTSSDPAIIVPAKAETASSSERVTTYTSDLGTASILLDGRALFLIGDVNSKNSDTKSPLAERVSTIQSRLYRVINKKFDPQNIQKEQRQGQTLLVAQAAATKDPLRDEILLVVTELDAQVNSLPLESWTDQLLVTLQAGLTKAQAERQVSYLMKWGTWSGGILLGAILGTTALLWLRQRLETYGAQQRQTLGMATPQHVTPDPDPVPLSATRPSLGSLQRPYQWRRGFAQVCQFLILLNILVLWLASLGAILGFFPWTRWLQPWLLKEPIRILGLGAGTIVAVRLTNFIIDRVFDIIDDTPTLGLADPQRQLLRFTTLAGVIKGLVTFVILLLSAITVLGIFHIPIEPLLASAGILGFGITLAAQNLVKDVINGTFILLEDQYAIGDQIEVAGESGTVEHMNLRNTQLRHANGALITIPHSKVSVIQNKSKDWSQLVCRVALNPRQDLPALVQLMNQVASELAAAPTWQDQILGYGETVVTPPSDHSQTQVTLTFKTTPGHQATVQQEFQQRLQPLLTQNQIDAQFP